MKHKTRSTTLDSGCRRPDARRKTQDFKTRDPKLETGDGKRTTNQLPRMLLRQDKEQKVLARLRKNPELIVQLFEYAAKDPCSTIRQNSLSCLAKAAKQGIGFSLIVKQVLDQMITSNKNDLEAWKRIIVAAALCDKTKENTVELLVNIAIGRAEDGSSYQDDVRTRSLNTLRDIARAGGDISRTMGIIEALVRGMIDYGHDPMRTVAGYALRDACINEITRTKGFEIIKRQLNSKEKLAREECVRVLRGLVSTYKCIPEAISTILEYFRMEHQTNYNMQDVLDVLELAHICATGTKHAAPELAESIAILALKEYTLIGGDRYDYGPEKASALEHVLKEINGKNSDAALAECIAQFTSLQPENKVEFAYALVVYVAESPYLGPKNKKDCDAITTIVNGIIRSNWMNAVSADNNVEFTGVITLLARIMDKIKQAEEKSKEAGVSDDK